MWTAASACSLLLLLACGDQRGRCQAGAQLRYGDMNPEGQADFVARCVKEGWSERKTDCLARSGDGFLGLFCDD